MSNKPRSPVSMMGLQERIAASIDALLDQSLPAENAFAIAELADKAVKAASVQSQYVAMAIANDRSVSNEGFLPSIGDDDPPGTRGPNRVKLVGGR